MVPESHFLTPSGLSGVWAFLGQEVIVPPSPEVCADTGVPGECSLITDTELLAPFEYTRQAILRLANEATRVGRIRRSTRYGPSFSQSLLIRGATVLARMKREIIRSTGDKFMCEVAPMSCTSVRVSEPALVKAFASLYKTKLPRELAHIQKRKNKEIRDFKTYLKTTPKDYFVCE